jgi:hypothetical protein
MKYSSILSIAAAVMLWPVVATAAPPQLKGTYAVTGTAACILTVAGFTAPPVLNAPEAICNYPAGNPNFGKTISQINASLPPAQQIGDCPGVTGTSFSIEGIRKFNGDGTGSVAITTLQILPPPNSLGPQANTETATFAFTYTLDSSGGFTSNLVVGTFSGIISGGLRDGQTVSRPIADLPLSGLISNDSKALTLASVTPTVETLVFSGGTLPPGTTQTRYRICHRSRVLIWLGN